MINIRAILILTSPVQNKLDMIRFILAQNGITSRLFAYAWSKKNVNYLWVSNLLLVEGLTKVTEDRTPYIHALKCLVLIKTYSVNP